MSSVTPNNAAHGLPIAAVERDTGLPKDTLRVWERRYGFPQPLRDAGGNRLYPAEQVERLKLIGRLLDAGQRPRKVVGLDSEALQALIAQLAPPRLPVRARATAGPAAAESDTTLDTLLDAVGRHDPQALRQALTHAQLRIGLADFVIKLAAPLTTAVGDAWAEGRFEVFEEHQFTEVMSGVLRHAIATLAPLSEPRAPRVLLTTLPQELHGLGLLMVEALLVVEGCGCVSLGTQTPQGDVVLAAQAHRADVVALSFSNAQNGARALASLRELRAQLPATTELWVGGGCSALYQKPLDGIQAMQPLTGVKTLVTQWRQRH